MNAYTNFLADPAKTQEKLNALLGQQNILNQQTNAQLEQQEKAKEQERLNSDNHAYSIFAALSPVVAGLGDELKSKVCWAQLLGDPSALSWISSNITNIGNIDKSPPLNVVNKIKWNELLSDEKSFASIKKIFKVVLDNKQKQAQQQTNQEQAQQ